MDIVKIPKKLRDVFDVIRKGEIEKGIELLNTIKGFEPQKTIALAEITYFSFRFNEAMNYDETALPFDEQWYSGNILSEHLFAYSHAALKTNQIERAITFFDSFLAAKQHEALPEQRLKTYIYQMEQHTRKVKGEKNLKIDGDKYEIIDKGLSMDEFVEQLKKYRPKLTIDSVEGADYILHSMFSKAATNDFLAYYKQYADGITGYDHHLNAAKLYALTQQYDESRKAIMLFVKNVWYPVDYIQVLPMQLWKIEEFECVLTNEFCKEILYAEKCVR